MLGLFVGSKDFVADYAITAAPLHRLSGKGPWQWGVTEQRAFERLKAEILSAPALYAPNYDWPMRTRSDASDLGVGGYLYQIDPVDLAALGDQLDAKSPEAAIAMARSA